MYLICISFFAIFVVGRKSFLVGGNGRAGVINVFLNEFDGERRGAKNARK
jgi:hypothetical protein